MSGNLNHRCARLRRRARPAGYARSLVVALAMLAPAALFAQVHAPSAQTNCRPLAEKLKYACNVMLMHHGAPLSGAKMSQRADMPSMPLAHNIPPTMPREHPGLPGQYVFEVELDMHGEWVFVYTLSSPLREQIRERLTFAPDGVSPGHSGRSGESQHHKHRQHHAD